MKPDVEGFLQPVIDAALCVHCGQCEKVCPVLHPGPDRIPLAVYAAKAKDDELRMKSSSGGMFTLLAREILKQGGIVYGAGWERPAWRVVHISAENEEELNDLRGSKYVQSDMSDAFRLVKEQLNSGRHVLFSGTPCQVSGLRSFLGKEHENLICVDLICHSVASPKMFDLYKQSISVGRKLQRFQFRDKSKGWSPFFMRADFSDGSFVSEKLTDTFLGKGWALGWFARKSCYVCRKGFSSGSDLTIADAWGCEECMPSTDKNKGVSLAFILTPKGHRLWTTMSQGLYARPVDIKKATDKNPCAWQALKIQDAYNFSQTKRGHFFKKLTGDWEPDAEIISTLFRRTLVKKILTRVAYWIEKAKGMLK